MSHQYDLLAKAADVVARRLGRAPVGVVLGSGLSECLDNLDHPRFMPYSEIPGMPLPGTTGHRGALVYGHQENVPVLALCGRVHLYEGRPASEVAMGVRLLSFLGVHTLVVTSAVGSVDRSLRPGHMMLVEDHINLSGVSVLAGEHEPRFGARFPDMSQAYDPALLDICEEVGRLAGVSLSRGVLAQFMGPAYETPAEIRMAQALGARVVSMSMVPDVLVARQRGMRVAGLACVTNLTAGLSEHSLDHDEVLGASAMHGANMQSLLSGVLRRLATLPEHRASFS